MGIFTKAALTIARGLGLTDQRLVAHFSGGDTDSGERVSVDGALQIGIVWACVRLVSQLSATLPFPVYRAGPDGHGRAARDHPLYRVLHDRPNYDMTAVEFWEAVSAHLDLWGNAYISITRTGTAVSALYPMRPDHVTVRREADGTLTYTYNWNGQIQVFGEDDVLHIKEFSLDGYMGISPIGVARNTLGSARAAERASGSFFRNGMRPSGVLQVPKTPSATGFLTELQREDAKKVIENFKGAHNTGKVPLLEGGWEFKPLSIPPDDAQLLETRAFHVEEICRWFGVPPIMIGHMGDSSKLGSSTEQVVLHFYTTRLRARLKRIEAAVNTRLFTPAEAARGYYAEFNLEGLLRADSAGRASYYSTMVQNGLMTRNEARAFENLPRKDGGDDLTVQSNLMPVLDLGLVARLSREKQITSGAAIAPGNQAQTSPQNGSSAPIPEIKQ